MRYCSRAGWAKATAIEATTETPYQGTQGKVIRAREAIREYPERTPSYRGQLVSRKERAMGLN